MKVGDKESVEAIIVAYDTMFSRGWKLETLAQLSCTYQHCLWGTGQQFSDGCWIDVIITTVMRSKAFVVGCTRWSDVPNITLLPMGDTPRT